MLWLTAVSKGKHSLAHLSVPRDQCGMNMFIQRVIL